MTDPVDSFSALLRLALGARVDPGATSFVEMFAEDGMMEFPFAPPGGIERIEGRGTLRNYLADLGREISFGHVTLTASHETVDSDTVVLEFEGTGSGIATGEPYWQRYVSIIRTRGGRIVHYKDYWNPLALVRATRGSHRVAALTDDDGRHD